MSREFTSKKRKRVFTRNRIFLLNFVLLLIPVTCFGYRPPLRYSSAAIIVDAEPNQNVRTFLIEFEKPVAYTLYIWPRMIF
jgi:hypothetical protein